MKNYVGRKIRGFRFEDGTDGVSWARAKEEKIGEIGEVESQHSNHVFVIFKNNTWLYPISLIEPHLIDECTCENSTDNTCNYCEELQGKAILQDAKDKVKAMLADGWFLHPKTVPEKIDEKYKVRLQDGTETEDYFTGFNWYWYDYTEIVAWKPTCI